MMATQIHIAVLDCDTPVPNVYSQRGLYSDIFEILLNDAKKKSPDLTGLKLKFSKYDSVRGEEPSDEELENINGVIITGSGEVFSSHSPGVMKDCTDSFHSGFSV